jgi:hypothetical protein
VPIPGERDSRMSTSPKFPPTSPSIPYQQFRPKLGTGDLVFLHGTSPAGVLIETLEEFGDLPAYSHVGMVVRDGDNLYLWDAPGGGQCFSDPYATDPDNRTYGTPEHAGCRVSVLDDVLAYYLTKVDSPGFWVRRLTPRVTDDKLAALRTFINRVDGLPFPAKAGLGPTYLAGQQRQSLFFGTYFCSQLVADSYMHMGLLEMEAIPPNGYSPAVFATSDRTRLPFVPPTTLDDGVFAVWPKSSAVSGFRCWTRLRSRWERRLR